LFVRQFVSFHKPTSLSFLRSIGISPRFQTEPRTNARPRVEVYQMHCEHNLSVRRLARAFDEPASSTGRWLKPAAAPTPNLRRRRPVSDEPTLRQRVQVLADQPGIADSAIGGSGPCYGETACEPTKRPFGAS